jgi:uncharacterized protein with von Willebrand factor type A (vWA) domain
MAKRDVKLYEKVLDGTAVLDHTVYDLAQLDEATGAIPGLQDQLAVPGLESALLRDVYMSLERVIPEGEPPAPLKDSYLPNQRAITEMMGTRQWADLRDTGTVGDNILAAVGASAVAQEIWSRIPDDVKEQSEKLDQMEQDINDLFNEADTLDDVADQLEQQEDVPPEEVEDIREQAEQARQEAQEKQQEAAPLQQAMNDLTTDEAYGDTVRQAARAAIQKAEGEVEAMDNALEGFGAGYGTEQGDSNGKAPTAKEKVRLAAQLNQKPTLKKLAELAGKMVRIALATQRRIANDLPEEVDDIEYGNDLSRLLPSELAMLMVPALRVKFAIAYSGRALMQYKFKGREKQGRGPIVVAVDESGSMNGAKDMWAKAVVLGLLAIARKQKRTLVVYQFSSQNELRKLRFEKGQATYQETLDLAEHFFGGGTCYEKWMTQAMDDIVKASDSDDLKKADAIIISDGDVSVNDNAMAAWKLTRKEHEVRVMSVLIGGSIWGIDSSKALLKELSDDVYSIDDLKADRQVTDALFSIGG